MRSQSAFSLVELSIVLVILGLLTGGILAGQSLIKSAEIKNIESQAGKAATAINTFRDKYFGLAGDITNATAFWGEQDPDAVTCASAPSTTVQTCNGDGNGRIENLGTGSTSRYESFRGWQQLANAGLIVGKFSGVQNGGTNTTAGVNVPTVNRTNVGIHFYYDDGSGSIYRITKPAGHYLNIGASSNGVVLQNAALTTTESYFFDIKNDDGLPHTGRIRSFGNNAWNPDCIVSTNDSYALTLDGLNTGGRSPGCQILVNMGL